MSLVKRVASIATGILILALVYDDSPVRDLPPGVVTGLVVLTLVIGVILFRIVMIEHMSLMLAERSASTEKRNLLEAEIAASKPLVRRLLVWGATFLVIGSAGFFGELVLAIAGAELYAEYADVTLPASFTLMAVGLMPIGLASLIKHRFIRFPLKKN